MNERMKKQSQYIRVDEYMGRRVEETKNRFTHILINPFAAGGLACTNEAKIPANSGKL
jgi:hypothetical protein